MDPAFEGTALTALGVVPEGLPGESHDAALGVLIGIALGAAVWVAAVLVALL